MFIVAQSTIIKCPKTNESIKKLCQIYTMEYYAIIRKDKILKFVANGSLDETERHPIKLNMFKSKGQISDNFIHL